MPAYDASRHDPPAPIARFTVRNPNGETSVDGIELLIDTGASTTLLPQAAIGQIQVAALPGVQYELIGFDGTLSVASVAIVDMIFLGRTYRGKYLLIDAEEGIWAAMC